MVDEIVGLKQGKIFNSEIGLS